MKKNNYLLTGLSIVLEPIRERSITTKLHSIVDQIICAQSLACKVDSSFQLFLQMEPGVGIRSMNGYLGQCNALHLSEVKSSVSGKSLWTLWKKNILNSKDKMLAIVALNQD